MYFIPVMYLDIKIKIYKDLGKIHIYKAHE